MRRLHKCSTSPPPAFFWTLGFGIGLTILAGILVSCLNTKNEEGNRLEVAAAGHYIPVPLHPQALVIHPVRTERCESSCTDNSRNDLPPPFEEPPSYEEIEPLNKKPESITET
jgi:hypothetical protein